MYQPQSGQPSRSAVWSGIEIGLAAAGHQAWSANIFTIVSDVFPKKAVASVTGIGGMVGMLLTGVFASKAVNPAGADGLFYGNPAFFFTQLKAMLIVVAYSFTSSFIIFKLIAFLLPLRVSEEEEELGLDATQHDEKYGRNPLKA